MSNKDIKKISKKDYQSSLFDTFKTPEKEVISDSNISVLDALKEILPFVSPYSDFSKEYLISKVSDKNIFYKLLNKNIIRNIEPNRYKLNDLSIINQYLENHNLKLKIIEKEGFINKSAFSSEEDLDRAINWKDFYDFVEFGTNRNENVVKFKFNGQVVHIRTFPYLFAAKLAAINYLESEGLIKGMADEDVRLELTEA